ncbi:DUF6327 family protein [Maribacter sp. PR1]|uniref:DUF6327 family protein n=1 Tax=Maribacter cobaltidurans TaxID=1178778 RepID=A0ABU7IV18_9FLAO|nr:MULTISPECIES: DUF6327 family protein [Maribacter]MDC6389071.1 DUF6327 family protein [Maribacter sp. PR1]MEE1976458.1 DUF6327 family protein [Maribacter cobaltidurans]
MKKEYSSFKEVDTRLKILKLQREIDQESLKLHYYHAKTDLAPLNLIKSVGTNIGTNNTWKNLLLAYFAKKVVGLIRKRRQS